MLYQSFKYYLVRIGLSLFLVLIFGYGALFFVHEMALPDVQFNDFWIKAAVIFFGLFMGFGVYGMFGEHRFLRALEGLKHIDLKQVGPEIRKQFQDLFEFTDSSYFLPAKGKLLRDRLIQDYAEFLLSTGSEDPEALNVFLKAFLQDPQQTRFRNVLVSTLTSKKQLTDLEIDLILVIMKMEDYQDRELLKHMINVFLEQSWFTNKSEPVFLKALQLKTGQDKEIVAFMLPYLLDKKRTDFLAINFYLESLDTLQEDQRATVAYLIGASYCDKRFKVLDPELHDRCQKIFDSLEAQAKERLLRLAEDERLSERWKKVRIFHAEDKRALERLKVYTGLSPTFWQVAGKKISVLGSGVFGLIKRGVFRLFDGMNFLGNLSTAGKLILVGLVGAGVFYAAVAVDWKTLVQGANPQPAPPPQKAVVPQTPVHTIQVAAVKNKKQADEIVRKLKKRKVEDIYIVKTPRESGGFWYKVRVGKFKDRTQAEQFAKNLQDKRTIRSYFIISLTESPKAG